MASKLAVVGMARVNIVDLPAELIRHIAHLCKYLEDSECWAADYDGFSRTCKYVNEVLQAELAMDAMQEREGKESIIVLEKFGRKEIVTHWDDDYELGEVITSWYCKVCDCCCSTSATGFQMRNDFAGLADLFKLHVIESHMEEWLAAQIWIKVNEIGAAHVERCGGPWKVRMV